MLRWGDSAMTMPPGGSTSSERREGGEEEEDPAPHSPCTSGMETGSGKDWKTWSLRQWEAAQGETHLGSALHIFPLEKVLIMWLSTMVKG